MTPRKEHVEAMAADMYERHRADHPDARMYPWSQQTFQPTLDHWRAKASRAINGATPE